MWSTFLRCPKRARFRYIDELVPLRQYSAPLWIGTLIHKALETYYQGAPMKEILEAVALEWDEQDPEVKDQRTLDMCVGMLMGYAERYPQDEFNVQGVEYEFNVPIVNPATKRRSKTFTLAGKVDGIVEIDGDMWLLEHKTADNPQGNYVKKIWSDFQILLYSLALRQEKKYPVVGVIYNVLVKSRRKKAIVEHYKDPGMFIRENVWLDEGRLRRVQEILWSLTQRWLQAQRTKQWDENPLECVPWAGRPCSYLPICTSQYPEMVIENHFTHMPPHRELSI
jgi:uncharacterized protein YxjI